MTLRMPAEWAQHDAVWIGFPHLAEEWSCAIDEGRRDVAAFANAVHDGGRGEEVRRSEEHTYELQSLMRISYAVFCLTKIKNYYQHCIHRDTQLKKLN